MALAGNPSVRKDSQMSRLHLGRATLLSLAALVLGASAVLAQVADSTATAELMALDRAWIAAEVGHDRPALERILDERFLATLTSGTTIDREAFVARILKMTIEPFEVIHEVTRTHGDVALVIDVSQDRKAKYSWIAVKREGQWRVISETFTKVETP